MASEGFKRRPKNILVRNSNDDGMQHFYASCYQAWSRPREEQESKCKRMVHLRYPPTVSVLGQNPEKFQNLTLGLFPESETQKQESHACLQIQFYFRTIQTSTYSGLITFHLSFLQQGSYQVEHLVHKSDLASND